MGISVERAIIHAALKRYSLLESIRSLQAMINRSFKPETRLIVFTDLDATLLHHHSYDWTPAISALEIVSKARRISFGIEQDIFGALGFC